MKKPKEWQGFKSQEAARQWAKDKRKSGLSCRVYSRTISVEGIPFMTYLAVVWEGDDGGATTETRPTPAAGPAGGGSDPDRRSETGRKEKG